MSACKVISKPRRTLIHGEGILQLSADEEFRAKLRDFSTYGRYAQNSDKV